MNSKLGKCPICGKTDTLRIMEGDRVWIECMEGEDACGLSTGFFDTEAEAIAAWNRKAGNCCEKCNGSVKPSAEALLVAIGLLEGFYPIFEKVEGSDPLPEVIDWLREVANHEV